MIDPKTIELMNLVLDGAATEKERVELEKRIAASPEARAHYDELRLLAARLDAEPMVDPPAPLRPRVLSAIDELGGRRRARVPETHGFFAWLRRAIAPPALRYASVFGLGVVAGVVAWAAFQDGASGPSGIDPSHVSGAITKPTPASGVVPVAVPEAGVSGSVAVVDRGSVTQVRLRVDGGGAEWVFDVPVNTEPNQSVVLKVVKSGETVFERAVDPVEP